MAVIEWYYYTCYTNKRYYLKNYAIYHSNILLSNNFDVFIIFLIHYFILYHWWDGYEVIV